MQERGEAGRLFSFLLCMHRGGNKNGHERSNTTNYYDS